MHQTALARVRTTGTARRLAVGVVAALTLTAGCAASSSRVDTEPVATSEVRVDDDVFDPVVVEVTRGTEVTWTWAGSNAHNVTADGFSSETQTSGTFRHTFTAAGTYDYVCTLHPGMTGRVVVTGGGTS